MGVLSLVKFDKLYFKKIFKSLSQLVDSANYMIYDFENVVNNYKIELKIINLLVNMKVVEL